MGSVQSTHEPEMSGFSLETGLRFHSLKPRCDFRVGDEGRKSLTDSLKKTRLTLSPKNVEPRFVMDSEGDGF